MKRICVTGGNKGIGLAICAKLLRDHPSTFVFLGSRDAARGHAAVASLEAADPSARGRVQALQLDVCDPASVAAAADTIAAACGGRDPPPLHGIVNNAGVAHGDLQTILQTNLYGVKTAVDALLPLVDPKGGRIVHVSSGAAPMFVAGCTPEATRSLFTNPDVTWEQINAVAEALLAASPSSLPALAASLGLPDPNGQMFAYGLSKALLNAYTLALAREHPGLAVNSCSPGYIETDLTRPWAEASGKTPASMGMKPPEAGALAPVKLVLGESVGSGRYYGSDGLRSPMDKYRSPGDPAYEGP